MKKKLHVDMDGVLCNFHGAFRNNQSSTNKFPQSKWGFFSTLEPIKDGVETVKELMEHFDVYILTRPSVKNPLCYTEKRIWVENYFGLEFCENLIMACDKSMIKGDYLIDDTTGNGQLEFEGELIQFGTRQFPDWKTVKEYLLSK